MKIKEDFITHTMDDKQVLVDTSGHFSGLVRSNKTAAFIVDCLKEETTKEQIIEKMLAKYDAPRDVIEMDVDKIIEKLRSIGAINE